MIPIGVRIQVDVEGKIVCNCQDCTRTAYHNDYGAGWYKGCVSLDGPIPISGIRKDCPYREQIKKGKKWNKELETSYII